jgi:hypothetical protein
MSLMKFGKGESNMEIKNFRTSKERLEQCGWELTYSSVLSNRFDTNMDGIKVGVGVDSKTYELYYIEISSNEDEHYAVLSFPELSLLMEKIKELEVEPKRD